MVYKPINVNTLSRLKRATLLFVQLFMHILTAGGKASVVQVWLLQRHVSESVDSLCKNGANTPMTQMLKQQEPYPPCNWCTFVEMAHIKHIERNVGVKSRETRCKDGSIQHGHIKGAVLSLVTLA